MFTRPRFRSRRWRDPEIRQEALEELVRAVAMASDSESLRTLVTRRFLALADCHAAWFVESTGNADVLTTTWRDGAGRESSDPITFSTEGPLATWLRLNESPLVFPGRTSIASYLAEDERAQLDAHGIGACIPIFTVGRLRAIILLASADRRWELPQDLGEFLMICGRHAGLAYETIERHAASVEQVRTAAHTQRLAVAGQFAAMVAHEVRNPLAIVRGAVQLVRDTEPGWEQRHRLLSDAMAEIDRISETVEGFLSLSRPAIVHEQNVDLVEVSTEAVRMVETYAAIRDIRVVTAFKFPSLRVWGDPRELRQIILNVLLNSTQAMAGAGTIELESDVVEEPRADRSGHQAMAVMRIIDTGPGIPADLIGRIFEPFVSTKAAGTGLGLAICSQIAARHGGRIEAVSDSGHGTMMTVYLPLRTGD